MTIILDKTKSILDNITMRKLGIGNRLKVARAERDLSQEGLAELVGVTRQTISSIETGQYCPSALLALTLSKQLGKPFEELFFLKENTDDGQTCDPR